MTVKQILKLRTQVNKADQAAAVMRNLAWKMRDKLQQKCHHPIDHVTWKYRHGNGSIEGRCDLCGKIRYASEYPDFDDKVEWYVQ